VGTLTTAAQTNITSVGTLGSLAVTGNISGGNLIISGSISDSAQLDISTTSANANIVLTPNGIGNVNTGANLSVTGTILGSNVGIGTAAPSGRLHVVAQASADLNLTFEAQTAGYATNLQLIGNNAAGSRYNNIISKYGVTEQWYIGGNGSDATIAFRTGGSERMRIDSGGTVIVGYANNVTAINNGGANGTGNIGTSTSVFNTVFAKATSAQYADLAEYYAADADYPPGTVLSFGGNNEVTVTMAINDPKIAGVVSTNPAHVMNAGLDSAHAVMVALAGRVPTLVIGAVTPGDMMVSAGGGRAKACATPAMGTVIGKALQAHPGGQGVIEIVVGRL
jgi:hypothetical protein